MLIVINVNAQYSKVEIENLIATSKKVDLSPVKSEIQIQELSDDIELNENQTMETRILYVPQCPAIVERSTRSKIGKRECNPRIKMGITRGILL